jgi:hypothetical protein
MVGRKSRPIQRNDGSVDGLCHASAPKRRDYVRAGQLRLTADALRRIPDAPVENSGTRRLIDIQIAEVNGGLVYVPCGRCFGRSQCIALPCPSQQQQRGFNPDTCSV